MEDCAGKSDTCIRTFIWLDERLIIINEFRLSIGQVTYSGIITLYKIMKRDTKTHEHRFACNSMICMSTDTTHVYVQYLVHVIEH